MGHAVPAGAAPEPEQMAAPEISYVASRQTLMLVACASAGMRASSSTEMQQRMVLGYLFRLLLGNGQRPCRGEGGLLLPAERYAASSCSQKLQCKRSEAT